MWNIATSSAPENSRGSAKKLRAKTSRARWRASSGKRSRSSTSAALTPVERGEGGREVDVEQAQRGVDVDGGQALEVEARAARHEGREVPRRGARDVRERVAPAAVAHERVVVERDQPLEGGVGAPQHGAQVVVLPEERVEAAAHLAALAVGDLHRPGPHPAAEPTLALEHRDPHAALGQAQRRGQPRDAAAHDDDVPLGCRHARGIRRGQGRGRRVEHGPAVEAGGPAGAAADHDGADPATVCTRPCCQPGNERCLTSTRPAASSRSQMRSTESKSRTLV